LSDGPSTTHEDPLEGRLGSGVSEMGSLGHIAALVVVEQRPPDVLTALTRSAGARPRPSGAIDMHIDFFERVHLRAYNREAATALLGDLLRDKAVATLRGPGYVLREVRFGTWPVSSRVEDREIRAGSPISWTGDQVARGIVDFLTLEGKPDTVTWADASEDPGWIEMDWTVADPESGKIVAACNIIDATWESPDGTVTPLDGFLDPYFQEVYLDVDTIPLFSRYVDEIGADSVSDYVDRLTGEVYRFTVIRPDYGKAARRMYNIFRLTGRYAEAAHIREIFDEPATALYQVAVSLRNLHEAEKAVVGFELGGMVTQVNQLITSAIAALEPHSETEVVRSLLRLSEAMSTTEARTSSARITKARTEAIGAVDEYYKRALTAAPGIKEYLATLAGPGRSGRIDRQRGTPRPR
jgi:hypothetical protein